MSTALVLANDQAAINGIRASGAKQLIIAPSSDYLYMIEDPINNTAMDIHEYLDTDFSGGPSVCDQTFPTNLAFLTSWLQQYSLKAMITEFGGGNNTDCDTDIQQAIDYMADNDGKLI